MSGEFMAKISQEVVSRLQGLLEDDVLGPRAEDALGDIMNFVKKGDQL